MTKFIIAIVASVFVVSCGEHSDHSDHGDHHNHSTTNNHVVELVQTVDGWTLEMIPPDADYVVGANEFQFKLSDADGPVDATEFGVEGWMPAHGHGTAVPTTVETTGEGEYTATVTFNMGGAWEVQVNADGKEFVYNVLVPM